MLAICFVILLLLKYVVIFAFAVLYLGGPVMIGLGAFPGLGSVAINALVRSLAILMLIPLAWATVFAAWAAINSTLITSPPKDAGAFALTVINGPGIFVASCLVVLGVTRALVKMATPLGAPLNFPGARLAMAAAAYKAAPAVAAKLGAGSEGLPGAEAVAEHNARYEGTPYRNAVDAQEAFDKQGSSGEVNLAAAGDGGAPKNVNATGGAGTPSIATPAPQTAGAPAAAAETRPAPSPGAGPQPGVADFDAARDRIAEQGEVGSEQVNAALERLNDDERGRVRDAAERARAVQDAAGGEEGDAHFREQIAAGMADGRTFRPESQAHAAVVGAGSHQAALQALSPPVDPTSRPAAHDAEYTERELRRDWTDPIRRDDEGGGG